MRALVVSPRGEATHRTIDAKDLDGAFHQYEAMFPTARDTEMQDIYVRRGDTPGTRESVCVFFDSAGCFEGKNPFFLGKTRQVCGGVLAVWARVAEQEQASDDLLMDRIVTEKELIMYAQSFQADLEAFVHRVSNPCIRIMYELFPNVKRVWSSDGSRWYNLNDFDLRDGSKVSPYKASGGCYDVDLLTFQFKRRTYCPIFCLANSRQYMGAMRRKYKYKFCITCHKLVTGMCSRCGKSYSCFTGECKKKAWRLHKPECVSAKEGEDATDGK